MLHLAIESSGMAGSVAIGTIDATGSGQLLAELALPPDRGSVQTLVPAVERLLADNDISLRDVKLISVTTGPGSFTGLRVGLTTAKMLSLARKIPIAPVDTLEAIALRYAVESGPGRYQEALRIVTMMNAFRKQVFAAAWHLKSAGEKSNLERASDSKVLDAHVWCGAPWGSLEPDDGEQTDNSVASSEEARSSVAISGPGLKTFSVTASDVLVAPEELWQPTARYVLELGSLAFTSGHVCDAFTLMPNYIRESAAEEKARR